MSGTGYSVALESIREAREEGHEAGYIAGHRMAWQQLLQQALRELRGDGVALDDPLFMVGAMALQLERARAALREVCEHYGDNDWDDKLDLGDVIAKHLHRNLDEAQGS